MTRSKPHAYRNPWLCCVVCLIVAIPAAAQESPVSPRAQRRQPRTPGRNAAAFLSYFDRNRFDEYQRLETYVVALTNQSELASSVQILDRSVEGDVHLLRVDWLLQIRPLNAVGRVENRSEIVSVRLAQDRKRWKIVSLSPVDFYRP